jgi:hypothetical protein
VFILKVVKVICFDALLQVLILKQFEEEHFRHCFSLDRNPGCPVEAFGIPPPGCFAKEAGSY